MEFVRRRRILRSSCPRDVDLFLLFFLLLFFVRFSNCSTSIRSYPKLTSLHTRREDVGERTRHFPSRSDAIRANNKETRKLDPEIIQDFSTFIERIGSARYFSKSSRNGNSKRIISGPTFPLPKWRNIVGDESGGVERYKGGGGCRV